MCHSCKKVHDISCKKDTIQKKVEEINKPQLLKFKKTTDDKKFDPPNSALRMLGIV